MNEIDDTNKTYHMDEIDAQRNHTITWMKLHMEEDDEQNYKNVVQVKVD
jgi:hypothetical protein